MNEGTYELPSMIRVSHPKAEARPAKNLAERARRDPLVVADLYERIGEPGVLDVLYSLDVSEIVAGADRHLLGYSEALRKLAYAGNSKALEALVSSAVGGTVYGFRELVNLLRKGNPGALQAVDAMRESGNPKAVRVGRDIMKVASSTR